ncbi:hypothetical protein [Thiohalorhabdus sp.]|uniref:hypothetical protein n=1 Tax=Thiohalorhabdus sp. TaxID=3094134 RepID=UPI002FC30076
MRSIPPRAAGNQSWVMIFHDGLPVAVSPVAVRPSRFLQLAGDPLGFEPDTRLILQLTPEGTATGSGEWLAGVVEGADQPQLRIRLDSAAPA